METNVVFEQKISIGPREFNHLGTKKLDDILLERFETENSGRCSVHGWVKPGTMKMLSRSMMQIEGGRFTGDMVCWIQVEGTVIYPVDGAILQGIVMKKNKMGLIVMYDEAIQLMVPRDLHVGKNEVATEFDNVQVGEIVEVEVKKSRFQVRDPTILSVGIFKRRVKMGMVAPAVAKTIREEEVAEAKEEDVEAEEDAESEDAAVSEQSDDGEAEEDEDEAEVEINLDEAITGEAPPGAEEEGEDEGEEKIQLRE
jgi:hypothetical protein